MKERNNSGKNKGERQQLVLSLKTTRKCRGKSKKNDYFRNVLHGLYSSTDSRNLKKSFDLGNNFFGH